ncbi:hypothetical protein XBP1_2190011 [Xenorhabdus bovienii str. puntauvense]|uniref:Uncharacterized protein n=3 Tax=Xenorhabdus TaxID=626 RepID=A0A2G0QB55_XENHO|nr:hypothetical protein Xhom_01956 [Xenorhabdus hominickii]CDG96665.1 hypothetical protein XBP1_2190011 [Xenorhabdus bovienii str. puntauvense]CDH01835.1 hypothetical protein XBFM1_2330053 [Xenorhabdus bovienii str. feltiae Moldova]
MISEYVLPTIALIASLACVGFNIYIYIKSKKTGY